MWCIHRQWERGCLCCATGTMFRSIVTISPFRSYPDCFSSVSCLLKLQVFLQYKPFGKLQLAIGQTVWDSLLADPHKYINIINFFMTDFLVLGLFPINPEDVKIVLHATIPQWFGQILGDMSTTNWLYLIRKYCCKENALFFEVLNFCEIDFELFWDMLLPRLYRVSKPLKPTQTRPPRERKSLCVRVAWAIISVIGDPIQGMSRYEYPQFHQKGFPYIPIHAGDLKYTSNTPQNKRLSCLLSFCNQELRIIQESCQSCV